MPARINPMTASRESIQAMFDFQQKVNNSGLEPRLLHLVSMLVSRINGCAYCIDMHGKDLRAEGETELRIDLVSVWEEVECLHRTRAGRFRLGRRRDACKRTRLPDEVYARAREQFSEEELVKLTLAVVAINGWNRLMISFFPANPATTSRACTRRRYRSCRSGRTRALR